MTITDSVSKLLTSCITELVDHPEDLEVNVSQSNDESNSESSVVTAEIVVNPSDVGKIIGRQGRTIKSLRVLARALGARKGARVEVEIVEEEDQ